MIYHKYRILQTLITVFRIYLKYRIMENVGKNFVKHIHKLRKEQGVTQEVLAELLGISKNTYSNIEKGVRAISLDESVKLSEYFGVKISSKSPIEETPEGSSQIDRIEGKQEEILETLKGLIEYMQIDTKEIESSDNLKKLSK